MNSRITYWPLAILAMLAVYVFGGCAQKGNAPASAPIIGDSAARPSNGQTSSSQEELTPLPTTKGGSDGGGGKAMVCYKHVRGKLVLETVELLDLWEGKRLRPYRTPVLSEKPVRDQVLAGIERLANVISTSSILEGRRVAADMTIGPALSEYVKPFFGERMALNDDLSPNLEPIRDAKLPLTNDSFEQVVSKNKNCRVEQVVVYMDRGKRIRYDAELLEHMNKTNVAALYLHEALYSAMRSYSGRKKNGEQSSIRIRRAISYVMSGKAFPAIAPLIPKRRIECTSFQSEFGYSEDDKGLFMYARRLANIPMMGFDKRYIRKGYGANSNMIPTTLDELIAILKVPNMHRGDIFAPQESEIDYDFVFDTLLGLGKRTDNFPWSVTAEATPDGAYVNQTDKFIECVVQE